MDLVEIDSFIREIKPSNLLIVVVVSTLFVGAGIFFGTFFNDISFDILKKYNIYNPEENPSHIHPFRILLLLISILMIISIMITISFLIARKLI